MGPPDTGAQGSMGPGAGPMGPEIQGPKDGPGIHGPMGSDPDLWARCCVPLSTFKIGWTWPSARSQTRVSWYVSFCNALCFSPMSSRIELKELWIGGREGHLSAWAQAKAVGLEEAWKELHGDKIYGKYQWIATRVEKLAGATQPRKVSENC